MIFPTQSCIFIGLSLRKAGDSCLPSIRLSYSARLGSFTASTPLPCNLWEQVAMFRTDKAERLIGQDSKDLMAQTAATPMRAEAGETLHQSEMSAERQRHCVSGWQRHCVGIHDPSHISLARFHVPVTVSIFFVQKSFSYN